MGAFDDAWQLLKALPEQQAFSAYVRRPKTMGGPLDVHNYDRPNKYGYQTDRYQTVHPAILGMLSRRSGSRSGKPNLHVQTEHSMKNPYGKNIELTDSLDAGQFIGDDVRDEDFAQRQRGSLFQEKYVEEGPTDNEPSFIRYEDEYGEPPVGPDTRFRPPQIG